MRIGILGGSFDPPHVGHLLVASDAVEALELDRLLFIPAGVSPFKAHQPPADGAHRLKMLELMVGEDGRFAVDPVEIHRAGLSYTADTLTALRQRWPEASLTLLVGTDAAASLHAWHDVQRIVSLASIAVLRRGGEPFVFPPGITGRVLDTRRVDVSSTEIRQRIRSGAPVHGFVPESVAAYLASTGLYR